LNLALQPADTFDDLRGCISRRLSKSKGKKQEKKRNSNLAYAAIYLIHLLSPLLLLSSPSGTANA
jgi:hypothetical protein